MNELILAAIMSVTGGLQAQQTAPAESAVKVEKITTAAAVRDREPVDAAASFSGAVSRVYTWTKVTVSQVPAKIRHIYYAGGKKAGETELTIASASCRTWSYKTVHPGDWKVEVVDEAGNILAETAFTVTAAQAAAGKPEPAATPTQGK
jgi:hypothetical protein